MLNINVNSRYYLFIWMFIFCCMIMIAFSVDLRSFGDDVYFSSIGRRGMAEILEWCWERYNIWSGRATIDLLTIRTINWSFFWKIGVPCSVLLAAYSMVKIVSKKMSLEMILCAFFLLLITPWKVSSDSFYWVPGFYNYLLPCSLALFCFGVVNEEESTVNKKILAIISVFIFSYQEQVVIIFMLALFFSLCQNFSKLKLLFLCLVIANSLVLFLSPGNESRLLASIWLSFPQFEDFGITHKALLGLDKLYQIFMLSDNWPLAIFLSLLCWISIKQQKHTYAEKTSIGIILIFLAFFILRLDHVTMARYLGGMGAEMVSSTRMYVWYFLMLVVMVATIVLLFGISAKLTSSIAVLLVLSYGVISVIMIGFSPTVYVSGYRVGAVFEIGLIMGALYLIAEVGECLRNDVDARQKVSV